MALEWVQSNVKFFGGDPGRVTISGQSAGAVSSSVLLTSVQSSGLFHQVCICIELYMYYVLNDHYIQ